MDNWSEFNNISFEALQVSELPGGKFVSEIKQRQISELPEGDLLIKVEWSGLNYKDALSASGHKGITRRFPHTPGIDAAGTVAASMNPEFKTGENVSYRIRPGHEYQWWFRRLYQGSVIVGHKITHLH